MSEGGGGRKDGKKKRKRGNRDRDGSGGDGGSGTRRVDGKAFNPVILIWMPREETRESFQFFPI